MWESVRRDCGGGGSVGKETRDVCLSFVEERVVFVCGRGQRRVHCCGQGGREREACRGENTVAGVVCYSRGEWLRVVQIELKLTFETTKELGD